MELILEKIAVFADEAHGDQRRKYADERYIRHPLRVMRTCQSHGYSLPVLAAAILHDVLEDTHTTPQEIREFLSTLMSETDTNHSLTLVTELTDIYTKERYPGMNRRKRKSKEAARIERISAEAQTIKYADIIDNVSGIAEQDADFAPVFLRECNTLLEKMLMGNNELRKQAMEIIAKEMDKLKTPGIMKNPD